MTTTRFSRRTFAAAATSLAAGAGLLAHGHSAFAQDTASPVAAGPAPDSEALRTTVTDVMAKLLVPGAVVLARTPGGEFFEAFGTRTVGEDDPVTTDDHFRIGSNTKTMTGTVLLQLVDEGLVALDDPVSRFRADVPNGDNILISQLLDMTSGLFGYSTAIAVNQVMDTNPAKAWDPEELVAVGLREPVYFAPGEGFAYSNTNTVLAGLIAEQLAGQPLSALFEERLFAPLGLTGVALPDLDDASLPDPHPQGYWYGTNVSTIASNALPAAEQAAAYTGDLQPNDVTDLNPSWGWAAGGAYAHASALADYVEALVGGGLLSEELQAERLDSLKPAGTGGAEYGLALAKFGPMIGHDGSLPGFESFMGHDLETGATLIVFTNLQSSPAGLMTANEIARPLIPMLAAS